MNPLASSKVKPPPQPPHPLQRHAEHWQHVNSHPPDALQAHVQFADYVLPILGTLASDPKVTPKTVIKAVSSAVADGKMEPSKAVAVISDMPADPDRLKPWLKERYAEMLGITVHAKAALLQQAQQGQQQAPAEAEAPPQPEAPEPSPEPAPQPMQPGAR